MLECDTGRRCDTGDVTWVEDVTQVGETGLIAQERIPTAPSSFCVVLQGLGLPPAVVPHQERIMRHGGWGQEQATAPKGIRETQSHCHGHSQLHWTRAKLHRRLHQRDLGLAAPLMCLGLGLGKTFSPYSSHPQHTLGPQHLSVVAVKQSLPALLARCAPGLG